MAFPRKRKPNNKATATPAKAPAPAKKTPGAKAVKKVDYDAALAALVASAPSDDVQTLLGADGLDDLWSKPRHYISTRNPAMDAIIGGPGPGIPTGRLTEIYGPEASSKTTTVGHIIAETQARGGLAVLADTEHALSLDYMTALGVDTKRMPHIQCHSIEDVFEQLRHWAVKGRAALGPDVPMLFAWDSVAGTPTRAEMAASVDQKFQAEAAKVIKQQLRAVTQIIAEHQVAFIVTNQVYKKMGNFYGPEDETYGGGGIKYHATLRIGLRYSGQVKPRGASKEDRVPQIGQLVEAKITKNKIGPPNRWRKYAVIYGHGVDQTWSLFEDLQGPAGVIGQSGSWFSLSEEVQDAVKIKVPSWQGGHFGLADIVREHPAIFQKLLALYAEKCK